jgi:hypothetical protein
MKYANELEDEYDGSWNTELQRHGDGTMRYANGEFPFVVGDVPGNDLARVAARASLVGVCFRLRLISTHDAVFCHHSPTGEVFYGQWKNDQRVDGAGVMMSINGDRYEGNWVNNQRSGRGKMMYSNGDFYDGTWLADEPNNQGTMVPVKQDQKGPGGSINFEILLEIRFSALSQSVMDTFLAAFRKDVAAWVHIAKEKVVVHSVVDFDGSVAVRFSILENAKVGAQRAQQSCHFVRAFFLLTLHAALFVQNISAHFHFVQNIFVR